MVNPSPVFGIQLPVQAKTKTLAQPWEEDAGPNDLALIAKAADTSGWGFISVCDHIAVPRDRATTMTTTWYDTIATLGWLAGITSQIRLAATVWIVPYRHPLQTAKAFSTLDAISGGRVILGVGAGHLQAEFEALGIPFEQRGKLLEEYLPVIRAAFTGEFGTGEMGMTPQPTQPGGPPIWVGGSSKAALRRAATLGDGWLPQGPPEMGMPAALASVQRQRETAGRADKPFAFIGSATVYVGTPSFDVAPHVATGSAEQIAERVRGLVAEGFNYVQPRPVARDAQEFADQMEAIGKGVIPLCR